MRLGSDHTIVHSHSIRGFAIKVKTFEAEQFSFCETSLQHRSSKKLPLNILFLCLILLHVLHV